jgi:transposase
MCDASGCPMAIEIFGGNTADPTTLTNQITKLKERFGIAKIIWVGARGIISSTTIQKHFQSSEHTALCVTKRYSNSSEQNNFRFAYLNIISHPIPIVFPQSVHFEVQIS